MRILGAIVVAVSVLFLVVSVWIYARERTFYANALRADGQVVEVVARRAGRSGVMWAPMVRFSDGSGRVFVFGSRLATKPAAYHVGDAVKVAYRPEQPQKAEIDSRFSRWAPVLIPGGAGAFFLLVGLLILDSRKTMRV